MTSQALPYRWLILLCGIFLCTRLYRSTASLEFFADIGRDHYVLMRAVQTQKPPLLGPSTSALPISQSPIYYYLNLPLFVLTGYSPYTTLWTLLLLFLVAFVIGVVILATQPVKRSIYLFMWTIGIFHPQLLAQTRYPWNPTFAFPFLMVVSAWILSGRFSRRSIWSVSLCMAIALGCTYSVLPVIVVLWVMLMRWYPRWRHDLFLSMIISLMVVFAPILIVDLRTHFLISTSVITAIHETRPVSPLLSRATILLSGITGSESFHLVPVVVIALFVFVSWIFVTKKKAKTEREVEHLRWIQLFVLSFLMTIVLPVQMQAHYLFGVLLLFLCVLASMHRGLLVGVLCIFAWTWGPSLTTQLDYVPRRTIAEMDRCVRTVCDAEPSPLYVSEQAWHSYHFAPEYLFFFNRAGCLARDVIQDPGVASRMAVVVDQSNFDPAGTTFAELTAFGPATVGPRYHCDGNIDIVFLEKKL